VVYTNSVRALCPLRLLVVNHSNGTLTTEARRTRRFHSAAQAATNGCLKKSFNQPAKLAERVLASGDGFAEPGDANQNASEPTKCGDSGTAVIASIVQVDLLDTRA
jgi:hypothetical protein